MASVCFSSFFFVFFYTAQRFPSSLYRGQRQKINGIFQNEIKVVGDECGVTALGNKEIREKTHHLNFSVVRKRLLRSAPLPFNQITGPRALTSPRLNESNRQIFFSPLCVRCYVFGADVSFTAVDVTTDRCAKGHDKRKPNRYLLLWCRVAYLHTQHLHTDGNDLCGHGDGYARAHNASSSLCCSSYSKRSFGSTQFLTLRSRQTCYRNMLYAVVSWCQATCRARHFASSLPLTSITVLPLTKVPNITRKRDEQYHKI